MQALVVGIQIVVALFLIFVVLIQPGNKGGLSAAFGGGGGESFFGARGANALLSKITLICAVLFMACNLFLSFKSSSTSVFDTSKVSVEDVKKSSVENPPKAAEEIAPAVENENKEDDVNSNP